MASAPETRETGLRRQLSAGHMAMISVGGSIGTGLLLGSGAAVQIAGPALILTYLAGSAIAFVVTMALGELACVHPVSGSFGIYAEIYLNPWAGFVTRYGYWISVVASVGAELVASATYTGLWFPRVPPLVWVVVYAAVLLFINFRTVGNYGRSEYWFAMIKVVAIVAFIVTGAGMMLGGRIAPQYSAAGGFFARGFRGPVLALSFALFSFLGTEMVAISAGEARSPRDVPRATRITFALLTFAYVGAIAVLVGVVPWDRVGVTQSPFVTVFELARIPAASSVMNFVVLTAALSGSNATLYVASRMLFSLAQSGYAPAALARVNQKGSPTFAILASTGGVAIAITMELLAPQGAFLYILGASLFGGMMAWCFALAAHIAFRRRLTPEQLAALPMRAPGGIAASAVALGAIVAAVVTTWWVPQSRITIQSGGPYLVLLSLGYLIAKRNSPRRHGGTGK